eukprot:15326899-Ditylum_brightwellii.AAC.1
MKTTGICLPIKRMRHCCRLLFALTVWLKAYSKKPAPSRKGKTPLNMCMLCMCVMRLIPLIHTGTKPNAMPAKRRSASH